MARAWALAGFLKLWGSRMFLLFVFIAFPSGLLPMKNADCGMAGRLPEATPATVLRTQRGPTAWNAGDEALYVWLVLRAAPGACIHGPTWLADPHREDWLAMGAGRTGTGSSDAERGSRLRLQMVTILNKSLICVNAIENNS
ncbi:hypothetical protein [Azoarcus sp. DD4]|uniref:hypothetical protein n=1 Tax=Azoarcus sp. DD4 TaxID=2027405 RepID=UPI00143D6383|nr:hypothetical protein [Azoarcus sp. DD4]